MHDVILRLQDGTGIRTQLRIPGADPQPKQHRVCAHCGADQYRRKVWETRRRRVLCMLCGQRYTFMINGNVIERAQREAR